MRTGSYTLRNNYGYFLKVVIVCLLIGFVMGTYLGYMAFSPMEDDFESTIYAGMDEGETAAKQKAREEFLTLYQQGKLNTELIEAKLDKLRKI